MPEQTAASRESPAKSAMRAPNARRVCCFRRSRDKAALRAAPSHIEREGQRSQKLAFHATDARLAATLVVMQSGKPSKGRGGGEEARPRRYTVAGQAAEAPRLAPGLYLVATPIGNLRDITLRALEILAGADLVACEDTRVSRKLFDHYGLSTPLIAYHDHNADAARPKILEKLAAGGTVALVSDAGTPLISDPGYKLVRAATAAGHAVTAAPGPSAA